MRIRARALRRAGGPGRVHRPPIGLPCVRSRPAAGLYVPPRLISRSQWVIIYGNVTQYRASARAAAAVV